MRQASSKKEYLIKLKLKKEDPVELPMDDQFFEDMHNKIMAAIDSTEIKPQTKWSKTKVFLERKAPASKQLSKKIFKSGISGWVTSISLGILGLASHGQTLIEQIKVTRF